MWCWRLSKCTRKLNVRRKALRKDSDSQTTLMDLFFWNFHSRSVLGVTYTSPKNGKNFTTLRSQGNYAICYRFYDLTLIP